MKKIFLIILICATWIAGYSQAIINRSGAANTVQDARWMGQYNAFLPRYVDTSSANLQKGIDSCGALIYCYSTNSLWFRDCLSGSKHWVEVLPSGSPTGLGAWQTTLNTNIPTDISLNGYFGTTGANGVGFYTSNTQRLILPAAGLTFNQVVSDTALNKVLTYNTSTKNIGYSYWYGGGSGATPTWQETLDAGSDFDKNNIVNANGFDFTMDGGNDFITIMGGTNKFYSTDSFYVKSGTTSVNSEILVQSDKIEFHPLLGNFKIDTLTNLSTQNTLLGWKQGSGQGQVGYITLGTGLSLSSGVLSNTVSDVNIYNSDGTLDGQRVIDGDNNNIQWNTFDNYSINSTGGTVITDVSTGISSILEASSGNISLRTVNGSASNSSSITIPYNSITIAPLTGQLFIDTLTSAVGTKALRYNPTTGLVSYADTTAGGGGANTALSNLASVAINTTLLPASAYSTSVGSNSKPFLNIYGNWLYGGDMTTTYGGYSGAILGGTGAHAVLDFVDNGTRIAELYTSSTAANFYTNAGSAFKFFTNNSLSTAVLTLSGGQNALIGGSTDPASAVSALGIFNGTAPTGSITNGTILYSEDVAASSELKVRDEAGNITVLSPHNFSKLGKPSEDLAWSYYSEKDGKYITVDMTKAIRTIEELTQRVYELEKKLDLKPKKPVKLLFKGKVKK